MIDRPLHDVGRGDPVGDIKHEPAAFLVPWTGGGSWQILLSCGPNRVDTKCPGVFARRGFIFGRYFHPVGNATSLARIIFAIWL